MKVSKVRISPYDYKVKFDIETCIAASANGAHLADELIIIVDPRCAELVQCETLLHEALHGMWSQTALDSTYTEEQEEQVIFTLAPRILALLRDNPELVQEMIR